MWVGSRAGWAMAASVGVHALVVAVVMHAVRPTAVPNAPLRPSLDTRVRIDAEPVREALPATQLNATPAPESPAPVEPPPSPEGQDPPVTTGGLTGLTGAPVAVVPAALPDAVLAHVRRFATSAAPPVNPALGPIAAVGTPRPAHGALAAGQRVVYLLDASGSMGEWGKFTAARDVLLATAAVQPTRVDVKVVAYAASAEVLTPAALTARTPAGRGDHLAGLRLALAQAPDFVVWFTDSDDLPTPAVHRHVRRAGKPVVFVARVGPGGVAAPVELR